MYIRSLAHTHTRTHAHTHTRTHTRVRTRSRLSMYTCINTYIRTLNIYILSSRTQCCRLLRCSIYCKLKCTPFMLNITRLYYNWPTCFLAKLCYRIQTKLSFIHIMAKLCYTYSG